MTDVVSEIKDTTLEVEKSEKEEVVKEAVKDVEVEKNGFSKKEEEEEKAENGDDKVCEKVENGSVKENGDVEKESSETNDGIKGGIKRKSEVGLESSEDAAEETCDKKQKVEETAEPDAASNGVC